jgi:NtrC-family two-component system sensor histidine kinase KinB
MNVDRIVEERNKGKAILDSIEDGLVVFDTEGKVSEINPACCRMLGVEIAPWNAVGCHQILPSSVICDIIAETAKTGIQPDLADDRRIIALGEGDQARQYLFSATAIYQKQGKLSGVILLLKDITQLREVERLKSEFVMAASHELRTPLTSLGMGIDLLIEHASQYLPARENDLLLAAHDEVHRMKTMVHDLLDLSKIETGRIDLEFEQVSVGTLFEHIRDMFRGQVAMQHINLTIDDTEFMPLVHADTNRIIWVLSNLVANALRYVGESGHIRLSASRREENVNISVADDGTGIPQEHQAKIFQKFVRVNRNESGRSGLGLAICKEIVRVHNGTIWVESQPGQGSTFTFTLPVAG